MAFAPQDSNFSYWQKLKAPLDNSLLWNIPEQKTGHINLIGGNRESFRSVIRTGEYLSDHFPIKRLELLLPDSLATKLPPLPNISFAPSTESGSFAKSPVLEEAFTTPDFVILAGDLSKNFATAAAISSAINSLLESPEPTPLLLTRDSLDLLTPSFTNILTHPSLFLLASTAQLQKIFRSIYYPRMIMLSSPLLPLVETLHKFTLTYPTVTIATFHEGKIVISHNGKIATIPIDDTDYSPITFFSGELAGRIAALALFNPGSPFESTIAALAHLQ